MKKNIALTINIILSIILGVLLILSFISIFTDYLNLATFAFILYIFWLFVINLFFWIMYKREKYLSIILWFIILTLTYLYFTKVFG
ncbi:MAG: hypothetical protein QG630_92 [Patescibacteria group bacterium]|nr:hypothetical protein [Patescibacteria group bacterium]